MKYYASKKEKPGKPKHFGLRFPDNVTRAPRRMTLLFISHVINKRTPATEEFLISADRDHSSSDAAANPY